MSTLVMPLDNSAPSVAAAPPSSGLFGRLIQAREMRARREVVAYLASQSDARLAGLGFSAGDVRDLRQGDLHAPAAR